MKLNDFTFAFILGFWPIWIVWEVALLFIKGSTPSVGLISNVARDRGYQMACLAFAWGSLAGHFWVNWRVLPWGGWIPGLIFFSLIAAVLAWDIALWNVPYASLPWVVRFFRFPAIMLVVGLLNGFLVFPQQGPAGQPI